MKKFEYNSPTLKPYRKQLRNQATRAEQALWDKLKGKQFHQLKFTRQYSVGNFILDFYCYDTRLGIELDGGQHTQVEARNYDEQRTDYLKERNIKILRFWNHEVLQSMDTVLRKIKQELGITPQPPLILRGGTNPKK